VATQASCGVARRHDGELLEVCETLELFALALAVDPAGFMAAIRGDDAPTDRSTYPSEQLQLKVVEGALQWASPVKAFFEAWSEAHASTSFQTTKRGLEKLSADSGRDAVAQPFLVEFEFRLELVSSCTDAAYMAELLTSVDREVCRVDYIALVVRHAEFEPAVLVQLFHNVEWWRSRGADVLIELYLPGIRDYVTPFAQWKPLFGLVARRSDFAVIAPLAESPSDAEGTWSVKVVCSEHDTAGESMIDFLTDRSGTYYTTARLFMASLVPLVRGDVSHVSFCRPLEDDSERWNWYDEVWVRVRWLAFLFRLGKSKSWSLQDTPLRLDHATLFVDVVVVPR
jgi:hypothetical protein